MTFFEFFDDYRVFRRIDRANRSVTPNEFFTLMRMKRLNDKFSQSTWLRRVDAGAEFYKFGKPYVKVFPGMAAYLAKTKVDIDAEYVKRAYPSFEIRFTNTENPFDLPDCGRLQSVLCTFGEKWAHFYFDFGWTHANSEFGVYYEAEMELKPGKTITQSIEEMPFIPTSDYLVAKIKGEPDAGRGPLPKEFVKSIIALAISTNFFLTSQHELVAPDIKRKHIDRYLKARELGDQTLIERLVEDSKRDGMGWFTLGSEIKLPRDVIHYHREPGASPERSFELAWAHVRSGFLRLQSVGPRSGEEKKLIFVRPTIVRPDLPLKPRVGYRLDDACLE